MNRLEESISRWCSLYLRNMQYQIDNAKSEQERQELQKAKEEKISLFNKNKTDAMPNF